MAYSTSNPPNLLVPSIGAKPALFSYLSTHTSTEANAAGFFTNGQGLGMKVGDFVLIAKSTGGSVGVAGVVSAVSSTGATVVTT